MTTPPTFVPLSIAVLSVSDSRTLETDTSGRFLAEALVDAGHRLHERAIAPDNVYRVRALVAGWIADEACQAVLVTGGTGFTGRDGTPEAVTPLLDKLMPGFGEMFRFLSYDEIGTSTLQSRALAGTANGTFVFCLPGSSGACRTAWEKLIRAQLDARTRPCNLAELLPRLRETLPRAPRRSPRARLCSIALGPAQSIASKSALDAPQSGQNQVSGRLSKGVPGATPLSGSPWVGS